MHDHTTTQRAARRGLTVVSVVATIVVIGAILAGIFWLSASDGNEDERGGRSDVFAVERGGFDVIVPSSGELAAEDQEEIRNDLETRAAITSIVDEGDHVKAGDVLVTLNDEDVNTRMKDAADSVNTAQANLVTAQANLDIKLDEHESAREAAELKVQLMTLALLAWREGEDVSKREQMDLNIKTAEINYDRLKDRLEKSEELKEDGFISPDEFERDRISMIEAEAKLIQARRAKNVYENYQFDQDRKKKESDLEQATAELKRLQQRQETEIARLQSDVASKQFQLESKQERLAKYEEQLKKCTITAPSDGLVVYASSLNSGRRWGNEDPPQVGTELRQNELIMVLPNTAKLVAEVRVNEALSGRIEQGQRASIVSDALSDTVLTGEVKEVSVLAESGGWRDPNRRDYTVKILLTDGAGLGLKPSMRCKADIFVGRVEDALYIPVQAAFRNGPVSFVYVPAGSGFSQKKIRIGQASEMYIEVVDGLEEGDQVLLREPATDRIVQTLDIEPDAMRGGRGGPPEAAPGAGAASAKRGQRGGTSGKGRPATSSGRPKGRPKTGG